MTADPNEETEDKKTDPDKDGKTTFQLMIDDYQTVGLDRYFGQGAVFDLPVLGREGVITGGKDILIVRVPDQTDTVRINAKVVIIFGGNGNDIGAGNDDGITLTDGDFDLLTLLSGRGKCRELDPQKNYDSNNQPN